MTEPRIGDPAPAIRRAIVELESALGIGSAPPGVHCPHGNIYGECAECCRENVCREVLKLCELVGSAETFFHLMDISRSLLPPTSAEHGS